MTRISASTWLALSWALSYVGSTLSNLAVTWLVLSVTGSGFKLGITLALAALPKIVCTIPAGAIADRLTPRPAFLLANGVLAVAVGSLGVLAITNQVVIGEIYAAAVVVGTSKSLADPAYYSLLAQLAPHDELGHANARSQLVMELAQLGSILLAGSVLGLVTGRHAISGCGLVFLVDATTYCVCLVAVAAARAGPVPKSGGPITKSMGAGFQHIYQHRGLLYMFAGSALVSIAITGLFQFAIPVELQRLAGAGGAHWLHAITISAGVGGVGGAFVSGRHKYDERSPYRAAHLLYGAVVAEGLVVTLAALVTEPWQFIVVSFVVGGLGAYASAGFYTMVHKTTPGSLMSRIMSLLTLISLGPAMMLCPVIGQLSSDPQLICVMAGVVMLAVGLIIPRSRHVRELLRQASRPTQPTTRQGRGPARAASRRLAMCSGRRTGPIRATGAGNSTPSKHGPSRSATFPVPLRAPPTEATPGATRWGWPRASSEEFCCLLRQSEV